MLEKEYVEDLVKNKIKIIDLVYDSTLLKLGALETRMALKYILLDDQSEITDDNKNIDKYNFISGRNGGRELIKIITLLDVYHILHKFLLSYNEINKINTKIDVQRYQKIKSSKSIVLDNKELLEVLIYSSKFGYEETYMFLTTHKQLSINLFDILIDVRYKENLKDKLDSIELKDLDNFYNTI